MSARSVILGLALGLFVSGVTYFNDAVIQQTYLTGNHFPIGVFGLVLLALIALNPLLGFATDRGKLRFLNGPLRPAELMVITAIGLAACGWPGSNFYRGLVANTAMPQHWLKTQAAWKAADVMSYVPGASPAIGEGHVQDWPALVESIEHGQDESAHPLDRIIWTNLPDRVRWTLSRTPVSEFNQSDRDAILNAINQRWVEPTDPPEVSLYEIAATAGDASEVVQAILGQRQVLLDQTAAMQTELEALEAEIVRLDAHAQPLEAVRNEAGIAESDARRAFDEIEIEGATPAELDAARERLLRAEAQMAQAIAAYRPLGDELNEARHRADLLQARSQMAANEARHLAHLANRWVLVSHWGGSVMPPPSGTGALVAGGRADEVIVDGLWAGRSQGDWLNFSELPWAQWWPTIRLWVGSALLLGLASLFMALIVHPQWSRRELLPYPIVKFLEEASERETGAWLPRVARNKLFWIGVSVPLVIHAVNGVHAWYPAIPEIPLAFDFAPLKELFPNAKRVGASGSYFTPILFMSVVAFSFFLTTKVSFSLGISQLLYTILGVILLTNGQTLGTKHLGAENSNLLRFGAYVAMTIIIFYTGRRYYLNVVTSALGASRGIDTPTYAPWAFRGLLLCIVGAVLLLMTGGFAWWTATIFIFIVMILFLVMARICAETGLFFNQAAWLPVGVLTAVFGLDAIGPTTYILLALASIMLVGDPRESVMPFLVNALRMTDRPRDGVTAAKTAPWLGIMLIVGIIVAGGITFYLQYNVGVNTKDNWAVKSLPAMPFDELARSTNQMASDGVLAQATSATGIQRLEMIRPEPGALWWLGLGMALVLVTVVARLRLPWWPLHPVAFLVWGTYPMGRFAFSFVIGWMIKAAVIRVGGAKAYHDTKPLMVGVIAGELFMIMFWILVGAAYYFVTGQQPESFSILPA